MSKIRDMDAGQTTTEYQETVVDPNLGEPSQVQCANCGAWRGNSRLYCPMCGARNVQSTSVFLTEEEILAKSGMTADELRATVSEPNKQKHQYRKFAILAGFVLLLLGGAYWAHQAREEALLTKQEQEQQALQQAARTKAQAERAKLLAAEKAKEAASAAAAADAALAAASAAAAAEAAVLSDDQATKLGLNSPAPKAKKPEPAPIVIAAPAPVVVAPAAPVAEPPKPEPAPVVAAPVKVETPQERLMNALAACKSKGGFFERNACEFSARKQFCPGLEGSIRECPVPRGDL